MRLFSIFLFSFFNHSIILGILFFLVALIIGFIWKKKRKLFYYIALTLTLVFSALSGLSDVLNTSKIAAEATIITISPQDEVRMQQIYQGVAQNNPEYLTPSIHDEYWKMIDKYKTSDQQISKFKERFSDLNIYMKYYYTDALSAYKLGMVRKSTERANKEKELLSKGYLSDNNIKQNDDNLEKIALRTPLIVNGQSVVLDESWINAALNNLDSAFVRLDALFKR